MDLLEKLSIEHNALLNVTFYLKLFLFGTLVAWYLQFLWKRRKLYKYAKLIPGPRTLPLIGNTHQLLGDGYENLNSAVVLLSKYSGLMRLWLGPSLLVVFDRPEYIRKIVNHPQAINKPYFYEILGEALREGLITGSGKKWRNHRKIISPSFNQKILDSFVEVFYEKSMVFVKHLKEFTGRKDIDFYHLITRCTLDIICQTAMGVDMDVQNSNCNFGDTIETILELMNYRIFRFWYHLGCFWKLSPHSSRLSKAIDDFHAITGAVIRRKLEEHEKVNNKNGITTDYYPVKKRLAFLDLIVEDSPFSEVELQEEVDTFLIAGTETSAATLCFVCVVLGIFPEVQEKLYHEVITVVGIDGKVLPKHLKKLEYMDRVVREVMRLFPIAPILGREINADIPIDNITIPEGCIATVGVLNLHRNPKYWPDPMKFDPDRFLAEEVAKRHPCSYIPFSFGVRSCIENQRDFVCGCLAAIVTTLATYPINKLTYRQILERSKLSKAYTNVAEEGPFVLYRGVLPPIFQKMLSLSTMFGVFHYVSNSLKYMKLNIRVETLLAGVACGTVEAAIMPLERVQLLLVSSKYHDQFKNTFDAFIKVGKVYGVKEYYRGLAVVWVRSASANATFFLAKGEARRILGAGETVYTEGFRNFVSGGLIGGFLSTVFYPFKVVKVVYHKQLGGPSPSIPEAVAVVYNGNGKGVRNFFRGCCLNAAQALIGSRYAMQNIKTILSTLVRQFTLHTEYKRIEDIKLKISIVLRMEEGMKLWLESRNNNNSE